MHAVRHFWLIDHSEDCKLGRRDEEGVVQKEEREREELKLD